MDAQAARLTRATGYGSAWLARASACAQTLRYASNRTPARLALAVAQLPLLIGLLCLMPRTRLRLSENATGERIRAHLRLRRMGLPRFRLAQGVLHLPGDYSIYLRGRSRQALRTNAARARIRGVRCTLDAVSGPTPFDGPRDPVAPAQRWRARNRDGVLVGEAWLTVDEECALLHSLTSSETDVRWLLHAAIVEHLCARGCRQLLTNSHDAFLMPAGQQYFQRRLGYAVVRLQLHQPPSPRTSVAGRALTLLVVLAGAAAVGEQTLAGIF
jgi:hypothetical protein